MGQKFISIYDILVSYTQKHIKCIL